MIKNISVGDSVRTKETGEFAYAGTVEAIAVRRGRLDVLIQHQTPPRDHAWFALEACVRVYPDGTEEEG